jgi:glycosyltransferase involved in cell wall biosynthesis
VTLSIVIPTHNRAKLLIKNLDALARQSAPQGTFEVIVVADDCADDTASAVRNYIPQAPYKLRLIEHAARNASATRNLGAAQAEGRIVLFLDDDITPEPALVQAHLEVGGPGIVVLGYSKPIYPEKCDWWQQRARLWWEDAFRQMERPGHRFTYRDFFSGNVSMPLDLFRSLGGFDLAIPGRLEDYEFGLRLLAAKVRFKFARAASGLHHEQTNLDTWLRRIRMEAKANIHIGYRYPALRNILFSEHFAGSYPYQRAVERLRALSFRHPRLSRLLQAALLRLAHLSEKMRWRGPYWYATRALRELAYWAGVAEVFGKQEDYLSYLQEGPSPVQFPDGAAVIDLALTHMNAEIGELLRGASETGVLVTFDEQEVMTVPPAFGAEALEVRHLLQDLQELAFNRFLPSPDLQRFLFAAKGIE